MKRIVFVFLSIFMLLQSAVWSAEIKPSSSTFDTLQNQFVLNVQHPFSLSFYQTAPGVVTVDCTLKGGPVIVYLRTIDGKVLATKTISQPSDKLTYTVTQADLQAGYAFNLALMVTRSEAAGTVRVTYPKVDRAALDAYLARKRPVTQLAPVKLQTAEKAIKQPAAVKQPSAALSSLVAESLVNRLGPKYQYPGTGTYPVPDVTNWVPRTRIAAGGDLIVQGRNLKPSQLNAYIGNTKLMPSQQMVEEVKSANEMSFKVPQGILNSSAPLVVYYKGGEVRTLEQNYSIYNPNVSISRVQPLSFSTGDRVTIYGTSLFNVKLNNSYSEQTFTRVPLASEVNLKTGSFIWIDGGHNLQRFIQVINPLVSSGGDTLSFMVGRIFEDWPACIHDARCTTPQSMIHFLKPLAPEPSSLLGSLKLQLNTSGAVYGPAVTWRPGGPKISKAYGQLFGKQEPFVILPTPDMRLNGAGVAVVEGGNLYDARYSIGSMAISNISLPEPKDGTKIWLPIPLNASSGPICGTPTNGTAAACSPASLQTFGGPVITRAPTMPLALGVNHTIEGLNLLPPQVAGLTYTFKLFGHEASNSSSAACNEVLEVIQHTSTRIVFRIGDPAKSGTLPAGCGTGTEFTPPANSTITQYKMYLWAGYQGQNLGLWNQAYYLRPWDTTAAPRILKFEGSSEVGTIDAAKSGNSITTPVVLNLGVGKSATLSWDLGAGTFDSADISGVGPITSATGSVTVTPATSQRYILSVRKAQAVAQKAIYVNVAPPPEIASFDCVSLVYPPPGGISYFKQGQGGELRWNVGYSWKLIEITPGPLYRVTRSATDTNRADNGSRVVYPAQQTTYSITASNEFGSSSKTCTLAPLPPTRIAEYTITPSTIRKGESATLTWRLEGLAGRISGRMTPTFLPSGSVTLPSMVGSITISPQVSQSITIEAFGPDNTMNSFPSQTLTIQVTQ